VDEVQRMGESDCTEYHPSRIDKIIEEINNSNKKIIFFGDSNQTIGYYDGNFYSQI
jgi:ABC-type Zn uptake system ZnuABC Zn-binding protein ZnuA